MVTTDEREVKRDTAPSDSAVRVGGLRRTLPDWQAQLIAIGITAGIIIGFVLLFSLLTGTL